jgi:hypothetical protein
MTPTAHYRAIAALSRLEGLAHALRMDLAAGRAADAFRVLGEMALDVGIARKAVQGASEPAAVATGADGAKRPEPASGEGPSP